MQGADIPQNQQCWFKCELKKKIEAGNVALATEYCLSNLKQTPIKGQITFTGKHPMTTIATNDTVLALKLLAMSRVEMHQSLLVLEMTICVGNFYVPQLERLQIRKINLILEAPCKQQMAVQNPCFHKAQKVPHLLTNLLSRLHCVPL